LLLRAEQVGAVVQLRSLITRLKSEDDYYVDRGLIEKALLAAEESETTQGGLIAFRGGSIIAILVRENVDVFR
jgi:hypothetical protein